MSRPAGSVRYDNSGRVVLVTGGASGIGRSICEHWQQSGATVVCLDVDEQSGATLPAGILFVRGDTSALADCERAVSIAVQRCGGLDVLINNAAIQPRASYVGQHEFPSELWDRLVAVNLTGYAQMAGSALRVMLAQGSGVVCNIGSAQAYRTARQVAAYGPIKAANLLQARQWGVEYARAGIRCVSISPGAILTPLVQATLSEQGGAAALANRAPLGRLGHPDEIAAATLWMCSSAASFVTATDLLVDGGIDAFAAFADPYAPVSPPPPSAFIPPSASST
jgi:NAD(P)-dependent dehydrogenase (short-subunit alcohol dehydrogenase family)